MDWGIGQLCGSPIAKFDKGLPDPVWREPSRVFLFDEPAHARLTSSESWGIKLKLIFCLLTIACVGLSSCSSTSEGVALGIKGSPAWNKTAPQSDINAFYDEMPTYELCSRWDRAAEKPGTDRVRRNISGSLVRRGEPEDRCFNADRDAIARMKPRGRNSYVPPSQPTQRTVHCQSSRMGAWVNTTCY